MAKDNFPMIAAGPDNVEELMPVHLYDSRYFQQYKYFIAAEWSPNEGLEESAGGRTKPVRLPFLVWTFTALTQKEFQFFKETLDIEGLPDALVTVRAYDTYNDAWGNYNAVLKMDEDIRGKWNGYEWREITYTFRRLKLIPDD